MTTAANAISALTQETTRLPMYYSTAPGTTRTGRLVRERDGDPILPWLERKFDSTLYVVPGIVPTLDLSEMLDSLRSRARNSTPGLRWARWLSVDICVGMLWLLVASYDWWAVTPGVQLWWTATFAFAGLSAFVGWDWQREQPNMPSLHTTTVVVGVSLTLAALALLFGTALMATNIVMGIFS
ncbi:MAG TPA: hypothetical protein VLA77_03555 [Candidatus Saccharimonadales bacterium]|nr:hypothetical protein [Candidatus Saccharimonadales bacterium]